MKMFRVIKREVVETVYEIEADTKEQAQLIVEEEDHNIDDFIDKYGLDSRIEYVEEL